jgi:hypothetical protein
MTTKFSKHKWWIVTALITVPLVAIAAVPNVFTANTVISSAQVNANFTALDTRLAALEAATAKTSVTVLNGTIGIIATAKTVTFTATGVNPLLLIISASAFSATGATLDMGVQFDGVIIGHLQAFTNEGGSHKAFPTRTFSVAAPAAGSHTIGLLPGNAGTVTNADDYYSVTVVELH